jgi:hypothetical protein
MNKLAKEYSTREFRLSFGVDALTEYSNRTRALSQMLFLNVRLNSLGSDHPKRSRANTTRAGILGCWIVDHPLTPTKVPVLDVIGLTYKCNTSVEGNTLILSERSLSARRDILYEWLRSFSAVVLLHSWT